jgi:hypothetical protein
VAPFKVQEKRYILPTSCRLLPGFLLTILLVLNHSAAHAADPPVTLEAYWRQLEETQALVSDLQNLPPEESGARLSAAADRWAAINRVILPDGRTVPVDHTFLVTQLRADPPDLPLLSQRLTTLLNTRTTWPPPHHSAADLTTLKPILVQPEFQWQPEQPSLLAKWWRRFWEAVWNRIRPWLPERGLISLDSSFFPWFRYLFIGLGSLSLFLVLFFFLRGVLGDFVAESKVGPDLEAGDEALTADTAFKEAQRLSGGGDYRTAVRYLYLSSLLLLDERRLLRYDRSQTNREYLRGVAHLPKLQGILREVIDVFDRVWYGYQPLDEHDYQQYAAQVTALRQQKQKQKK